MAKVRESVAQRLEVVRGERGMSKDEFATALNISRQWYHSVLNNEKEIPLKIISELSVDHQGEWLGDLADFLIEAWHGEPFLPIGSREELMRLRGFLQDASYEDLREMARRLDGGHFGLWAAELQDRLEKQLAEVKAANRVEVDHG